MDELQRQPGTLSGPLTGLLQCRGRTVHPDDAPMGTHPLRQQQGQIGSAAAEIYDPRPRPGLEQRYGLAFPEAMKTQAEQIVEPVVGACGPVKQAEHGGRLCLGKGVGHGLIPTCIAWKQ